MVAPNTEERAKRSTIKIWQMLERMYITFISDLNDECVLEISFGSEIDLMRDKNDARFIWKLKDFFLLAKSPVL